MEFFDFDSFRIADYSAFVEMIAVSIAIFYFSFIRIKNRFVKSDEKHCDNSNQARTKSDCTDYNSVRGPGDAQNTCDNCPCFDRCKCWLAAYPQGYTWVTTISRTANIRGIKHSIYRLDATKPYCY